MADVRGATVDIPTPDGAADAYLVHPAGAAAQPGVLLFQDAFGIRPALRAVADRIAASGYTVLVPNVFHRLGRAPVFDLPEFIGPDNRAAVFERIVAAVREVSTEDLVRDAGAYLEWMAGAPQVADGPVGLTGYCMGVRLVLRTAAAYPDRVVAAAGFHGSNLVGDTDAGVEGVVGDITAQVYLAFADADPGMTAEHIETLDKALAAGGVRARSEVYTGAAHGFTQIDTSEYHAEAAERHHRELVALFGRALRGEN